MITTIQAQQIKKQAKQLGINVMVFIIATIMLIAPAVLSYASIIYLDNIAGLIPMAGYIYVYEVYQAYFE